jgi:hypothetical protein
LLENWYLPNTNPRHILLSSFLCPNSLLKWSHKLIQTRVRRKRTWIKDFRKMIITIVIKIFIKLYIRNTKYFKCLYIKKPIYFFKILSNKKIQLYGKNVNYFININFHNPIHHRKPQIHAYLHRYWYFLLFLEVSH